MGKKAYILLLLSLLSGCDKYYLSVCQQKVDSTYLASSHVGTPDPRQKNPPIGQMLIIDWKVPRKILEEKPSILLKVIYWDYSASTFTYPIEQQMGYKTYSLLNRDFEEKKGILTYKAEIITDGQTVYKEWVHQLWVQLIQLDSSEEPPAEPPKEEPESREERSSSAESTSSSVDSQPMQGSVIETEPRTEETSSESL